MLSCGKHCTTLQTGLFHTCPEPTELRLIGFFDRINLDPKIQINYVDTQNQLADILTKGNFTRDEWNHLLCLFNISIFTSASCPKTMSKRIQERTGEEIIMAKSRPTLNLVLKTVASSSASNVPVLLKATSRSLSLGAMCEKTCS